MDVSRSALVSLSLLTAACDDVEPASTADSGQPFAAGSDASVGDGSVPLDAARPFDAGSHLDGGGTADAGPVDAGPTCEDALAELETLSVRSSCASADDCVLIGACNTMPWFGIALGDESLGRALASRAIAAGCDVEQDWFIPTAECVGGRCLAQFYADPENGEPGGESCQPADDGG